MLRIRFTAQDLLRLRFATRPAPMVELTLALMTLRRRTAGPLGPWRDRARKAFPEQARPLLDLVFADSGPEYLDSLDPDFDAALDAVLGSPPGLVRISFDRHSASGWVRRLAEGEREAQRILERALRSAHAALLAPSWSRVVAGFHADLAHRNRLLHDGGIVGALPSVFPGARWRGEVLEAEVPGEQDVHLTGEGLILLPVAFWSGPPTISRAVPGRPRLLMYPARIPLPVVDDAATSLESLLGRTRAAVLGAITAAPASTTTELARRLGISPGRASEHASVLRGAGLVTSHRHRNTVLHSPTRLGHAIAVGHGERHQKPGTASR
ncbi:winged helix-turn-helix domain-containing protein [Nonomuraea sediminis]|uniref:winged helix-turn-helix domain-containing protein n=1 Tax=Nonomuraea sediminis TaxID=2835864 RepID=UPI001BDC49AC|nr:winged helix-turn-helix domain-containing protein [Nonomuraea sediminis]